MDKLLYFKDYLVLKVESGGLISLPAEEDLAGTGRYDYRDCGGYYVVGGNPGRFLYRDIMIFRRYPRRFLRELMGVMRDGVKSIFIEERGFKWFEENSYNSYNLEFELYSSKKRSVFKYSTKEIPKVYNDLGMLLDGDWLYLPPATVGFCESLQFLVDERFPMGMAIVDRRMCGSCLAEKYGPDKKVKPYSFLIARHIKYGGV